MKTTVIGSYPKVAEEAYGTKLIGAINRRQKQELSEQELQRVFDEVTRAVIEEQEALGLDIITDGQIRWEDLVTPLASQWSGVEITGLTRYFNNNTYYRTPVIKGRPKRQAQRLAQQFAFATSCARRSTVKAVLPGPWTMAQLCEDQTFRDDRGFLQAMAQLIREEVEALVAAGARVIQLDEPALAFGQPKAREALSALHLVVDNVEAAMVVHVYFGAPKIPLESLLDAELDGVGLDFVEAPQLADQVAKVKWPTAMGLGVGCVDARNTKLERPEELKRLLTRIATHVSPDRLFVSPNCGLEFLPHDKAIAKLRLLVGTVQACLKEGALCS